MITRGFFGLICILSVASVFSATFYSIRDEVKGLEGLCYTPDNSTLFPVGTTIFDTKHCWSLRCSRNAEKKYLLEGAGCGKMAAGPPCVEVPGKAGLPYPACCPTIKCPEDKNSNFIAYN